MRHRGRVLAPAIRNDTVDSGRLSGAQTVTIAAALAAILLAGCGALPPRTDVPMSVAAQPSRDSPLVRIAEASTPSPELSGFRLMPHAA